MLGSENPMSTPSQSAGDSLGSGAEAKTLPSRNLELELALKAGIACTLVVWVDSVLHLPYAWVGTFVCYYLMTRYRSYSPWILVSRALAYTLTGLLFLAVVWLCATNRFLLLTAIVVVTAPYLYVGQCGMLPMPLLFGGPLACIPLILAWNDPVAATTFTVAFFSQFLVALVIAFCVTQLGGRDLVKDPLWGLFPESKPVWPIRRRELLLSLRPTMATGLAALVVVLFNPPGLTQIIVTALVMSMQPSASYAGHKVKHRFIGCIVGALLGFAVGIFLTYASYFGLLLLIVLLVYTVLAYYFVQEIEYWYSFQQVGVAFAMVVITPGPLLSHTLVVGRFEGVTIGALVGAAVYLIPLPDLDEPA